MDPIILGVVSSILGLWLGSVEIRMRTLDNKLRDVPSRIEVESEIEVRLESVKVLQREIKEDISHMRKQLEELIRRS